MLYPISFPAVAPATERLTLNHRQSATESTWTFAQQTVHTASQWMLEWTWPQMTFEKAEGVAAWLQSLKGQIGTFRYAPRQSRAYIKGPLTLATNGYAYGDTISILGFASSGATGFRLGQFFQLGDQLLQIVVAPANAAVNGAATISFEPELRRDFAGGTAVNFINPSGLFRLASSSGIGFTLDPDKLPIFGTIQAREAV